MVEMCDAMLFYVDLFHAVCLCCMQQLVNEFRQMAEDAWKRVHWLFVVDDDWKLEKDVDDICVYSQYSSNLGKILRLEVSYLSCVTCVTVFKIHSNHAVDFSSCCPVTGVLFYVNRIY